MPFRMLIKRAAQLVFVPQSAEIIALSSSSSETALAITCGLSGLSVHVLCSLNKLLQLFMARCFSFMNSMSSF